MSYISAFESNIFTLEEWAAKSTQTPKEAERYLNRLSRDGKENQKFVRIRPGLYAKKGNQMAWSNFDGTGRQIVNANEYVASVRNAFTSRGVYEGVVSNTVSV